MRKELRYIERDGDFRSFLWNTPARRAFYSYLFHRVLCFYDDDSRDSVNGGVRSGSDAVPLRSETEKVTIYRLTFGWGGRRMKDGERLNL